MSAGWVYYHGNSLSIVPDPPALGLRAAHDWGGVLRVHPPWQTASCPRAPGPGSVQWVCLSGRPSVGLALLARQEYQAYGPGHNCPL